MFYNESENNFGELPISRDALAFGLLAAVFSGALAIAAVLANKVAMVFGLVVPAGVVAYALTFPVTDMASEVWGKKAAGWIVLAGFIALLVTYALIQTALLAPAAPFYSHAEEFKTVVGATRRVILASFLAYLVSQTSDVWLFHLLKRLFKGRHLWIRNNASTMISQLLDSAVFCTAAFYGQIPVLPLILGQWVIKMIVAAADTPLVYAGVAALRGWGVGKSQAQPSV